MTTKVAIVGRPNVGKSTLFNRLADRRLAIVHNSPGVTRDWCEAIGSISDLSFTIIDTPGFDNGEGENLLHQMVEQIIKVIKFADVIIFVIDGREGITILDQKIASMVRKFSKPTILLANKCESNAADSDIYSFGFEEPINFSAIHGQGLLELYSQLKPYINSENEEESKIKEKELQLAVVGCPNVGKSTLINSLIKEERLLTGEKPGVTRDAVTIKWQYKGRVISLVDTAGLRKKSKIIEKIEGFSIEDTHRAIRFSQVVILVLDVERGVSKQDLNVANHVISEGRALIIALNKWDLVKKNQKKFIEEVKYKIEKSLSQVKGILIIPISGKESKNLDSLLDEVLRVYALWNIRLSTPKLNLWLNNVISEHPLPISVKIKYIMQINVRPPTFVLFSNKPKKFPDHYMRYLLNSLRDYFKLPAIPIRILLKKGKNPYVK